MSADPVDARPGVSPKDPEQGQSVPSDNREPAARCLEHVHYLSVEIGPRGSTTAAEAAAAAYARDVLEKLGLSPQIERFSSAISLWWPYALAMSLALLAIVIYPFGGRVTAILATALVATTLVSVYLELGLATNPLRWLLPKRLSQNVWTVIPPAGAPSRRLVLMGHLDSHRTPFIFRSTFHIKILDFLETAVFISMAALVLLYIAGSIVQSNAIYFVSLASLVFLIPTLIITLQADLTPYSVGANDNASGTSMVLALAERLKKEPLANTEVWAVNSGCEEVSCYGVAAFLRAHRQELKGAYFIDLDAVGGRGSVGPCFLTREGIVKSYRSDPGLVALADQIAVDRPNMGVHSRKLSTGFTETMVAIKNGLASLTILNVGPDGYAPYWHKVDDVFDNIDADLLARTEAFVWELLQRIDAS